MHVCKNKIKKNKFKKIFVDLTIFIYLYSLFGPATKLYIFIEREGEREREIHTYTW